MDRQYGVAMLGFSPFEREALAAFFRLAPGWQLVDEWAEADFVVADSERPDALDAVRRDGRIGDTVFVGSRPPPEALACLPRPIDARHVAQALDVLAGTRTTVWADAPDPSAVAEVDLLLADLDATARHPLAGRAGGGGGRAVLVVDDSPIARKFLAQRLARLGYRVRSAANAGEALAALAEQRFSIAFVDLVLGPPGTTDGLDLTRQIKADPLTAPAVVIASGHAAAPDRVRGSLAGCDAFLGKPIAEADLVAALRHVDPAFARA